METCSVVLTLCLSTKSSGVTNQTSSAVLFHGTICFAIFYKTKFGISLVKS